MTRRISIGDVALVSVNAADGSVRVAMGWEVMTLWGIATGYLVGSYGYQGLLVGLLGTGWVMVFIFAVLAAMDTIWPTDDDDEEEET